MFSVYKNQVLFCHLDKLSDYGNPVDFSRFYHILSHKTGYATGYGFQYEKTVALFRTMIYYCLRQQNSMKSEPGKMSFFFKDIGFSGFVTSISLYDGAIKAGMLTGESVPAKL